MLTDILVGAASAASSVPFIKPLIYLKNQTQSGSPISKNPREWYRGGAGFAASFLPTVGIQTAATGFFNKYTDPLAASAAGGAASAFVVCPAEAIMIQQEKHPKHSYSQVTSQIIKSYGVSSLFRSLIPTMVREGGFTFGYMGLGPKIKAELLDREYDPTTSQIASGVIAGSAVATFTHPFDTVKTRQQSDLLKITPTLQGLRQPGVFKGVGWRCAMMSIAVTTIAKANEVFKDLLNG